MVLSQRQLKIFQILLHSDDYIKCETIANKLGVSLRSIKTDIHVIKIIMAEQNITIETKRNKGVKLIQNTNTDLKLIENEISKKENNFGDLWEEKAQRIFLLTRIVLNKLDWFTIDELSEDINYSKNYINQLLPEVKKRLSKYQITIKAVPRKGFIIQGSEINIREGIIDLFDENGDDLPSNYFINEFSNIDIENIYKLRSVLNDVLIEQGLICTQIIIDKIVTCIFVSVIRNLNKKNISDGSVIKFKKSSIFAMVQKILDKIDISLPESEICYITLYILSVSNIRNEALIRNLYFDYVDITEKTSEYVNEYLYNAWNINLNNDFYKKELFNILLRNKINGEYNLYDMFYSASIREYSKQSPVLTDISFRILEKLHKEKLFNYTRNFMYSLLLLLDIYFREQFQLNYNLNEIVIIPNIDILSAEMYKSVLEKRFKQFNLKNSVGNRYENNQNSLFIIIDNKNIKKNNVLNVDYYINENQLLMDIISKINDNFIRLPNNYEFSLRKINITEKIELEELFVFISGMFTNDINKQISNLKFLKLRESYVTYGIKDSPLVIILLFNQEEKGTILLKLSNSISIKYWNFEYILVISTKKTNLSLVDKVTKWIMKNPQEFLKLAYNSKNNQEIAEYIYKKAVII